MAVINLRKHYYPLYTKDTFIEVPDEVAAVMEECRLYENRQEGRKSYYHVYSIDCSPGIENHAMFLVQSPEDLIIREIDEAAEELLLERLAEAISHLSPTQARRLSEYMASTGKTYKSHAATIRRWAKEDRRKGKGGISDYSCKEGESL